VVRVTESFTLAISVGVVLGLGLWSLVAALPRLGSPRLGARIAPYLLDASAPEVSAEARRLVTRRGSEPASVLAALLSPMLAAVRSVLGRVLGGDASVARRLRQADSALDVSAFRSRQLLAGAGAAMAALAGVVLVSRTTTVPPVLLVALVAIAAIGGVLVPEQLLARRVRARSARIAEELPTVLEFLTLSLSAGEGVLDALRRVARTGSGELARELGRVVAEVNAGGPLPDALNRCSSAVGLPALTRAVEQLVGALDRGTPLVGVLRAQAQDSRDDAKRRLLEIAGTKEVAMLVPLVFLILPVTVLFAIFPATLVLQLGF
jgi:tight adherence protein C